MISVKFDKARPPPTPTYSENAYGGETNHIGQPCTPHPKTPYRSRLLYMCRHGHRATINT
jgi:hypothetical protein